ncbi:glycosyltransferase family 4 protein [uncultured Thermanaerothrix sp.]|uniref:glycosyltransferase family 4 protein n=1 Tax=uncultured Thermanaerothrix sp. TaxID=1195149 RepID=UPI002615C4AC|nr:glycosyltransferase family 4 protein [uncultured Thermanaerothrix sp.]
MRVGLVIYGDLNTLSGGYLYDRYLVQHLRSQGDEVDIISLPWTGYGRTIIQNLDREIESRLRSTHLDVLLQDELNHPSLFLLNARIKKKIRYPILSIVHHLRSSEPYHAPLYQRLYGWIERAYLNTLDGFIYNSQATRQSVERICRAAQTKPHCVAYPGGNAHGEGISDRRLLEERSHQPGPLRILFLGNLIRRKRLDVLLQALHTLPRSGWILNIVGRTDLEPETTREINAFVHQNSLVSNIRFWGPCSSQTLQALLVSHHVLAMPSDYEGFGIVYLEAMAYGLVPIATTCGGAVEIITHGLNGFLIPPNDPQAVAQALQELSNRRDMLAQMSVAARARYEQFPTWEQSMAKARRFLETRVAS